MKGAAATRWIYGLARVNLRGLANGPTAKLYPSNTVPDSLVKEMEQVVQILLTWSASKKSSGAEAAGVIKAVTKKFTSGRVCA